MSLFRYRVADSAGRVQEVVVEGGSSEEAAGRVRGRGLVPIQLLGSGDGEATGGSRGFLGLFGARGGADGGSGGVGFPWGARWDAVEFTDRLAPLLEAEIPLERALEILEDTSESGAERRLIGEIRQGLHEGKKLSQLVRDRGRMFPAMYASIVEAGEEAGALPGVVAQLRTFLLMMRDLRAYIISASIYPMFVLVFSVLVVGVLLGVVIPRLATVLTSGAKTVPGSVGLLLNLSSAVRDYWWAGLIAAVVLYLLGRVAWQSEGLRSSLDGWLLRLPLTRRFVVLTNLSRQARTMALLMRSGVHLLNTVSISTGVLQNRVLREVIANVTGDLRRGERLSAALARSPYIPKLMIRMIAVSC